MATRVAGHRPTLPRDTMPMRLFTCCRWTLCCCSAAHLSYLFPFINKYKTRQTVIVVKFMTLSLVRCRCCTFLSAINFQYVCSIRFKICLLYAHIHMYIHTYICNRHCYALCFCWTLACMTRILWLCKVRECACRGLDFDWLLSSSFLWIQLTYVHAYECMCVCVYACISFSVTSH